MKTLTAKKATMQAKPRHKGYIMYQGPSALNGAEIVAIATMKTSNIKTGEMVQVWILDANTNPVEAVEQGLDVSVCGNCPHRNSTCYVNVGQAPNAIYKAFKRGLYPVFNLEEHASAFTGRMVRLGAYGDPAAAPFDVMSTIALLGKGHTGYTHQASHKGFDKRFLSLCMVSADTPKQAAKWQAQGAKTFRVALAGDSLADNEIECMADSDGIQCIDCGLCDGQQQNIAITVHGSRAKNFKSTMLIPAINLA